MKSPLQQLGDELEGELYDDKTMRILYATDASAYREMPLAVAIPKSVEDIKKLIAFAHAQKTAPTVRGLTDWNVHDGLFSCMKIGLWRAICPASLGFPASAGRSCSL